MGIENLDVKTYDEIVRNAAELTSGKLVQERQVQKARIKAILNGGADGIKALLGNTMETSDADLLPAPIMLQSGIDRLAQKISGIPQVRVDVPNDNDSNRSKIRAEKLERIVTNYDEKQNLLGKLQQAARWLPGYGYCAWVITTKRDTNGFFYPSAELRDPYDTFVGNLGPDQQPREMAVIRRVPRYKLAQIYPEFAEQILRQDEDRKSTRLTQSHSDLVCRLLLEKKNKNQLMQFHLKNNKQYVHHVHIRLSYHAKTDTTYIIARSNTYLR